MIWNVVVPSLETIIDRHVFMQATLTLKITGNKSGNEWLVNYGVTDALAPFPLNSIISTMQIQINNNNISMQVAEILPMLLRLYDPETLAKYDSLTPTTLDQLADYADAVQKLRYTVAGGAAANDVVKTLIPADAASAVDYLNGKSFQQYASYNNNTLSYDQFRTAGSSHYHRPRGSFKIDQIFYSNDGGKTAARVPSLVDTDVYVKFTVVEPIFVPPFLAGCDSEGHHPGFYGINSLNITANFATNASRAWRCCKYPTNFTDANPTFYNKTATLVNVEDAKLIVKFYSPKGSQLQDPRSVVNFHDYQLFRTTNLPQIDAPTARNVYGLVNNSLSSEAGKFPPFKRQMIISSNIQLSCIPDKLIVCARKIQSSLTCSDPDTYLVIKNIRLNFNNQAGILSTYTPEQLYDASVQSGLANLTYREFVGNTISQGSAALAYNPSAQYNAWGLNPYAGQGSTDTSQGIKMIPLTGSLVVLDFARFIPLPSEYDAPSAIGQYNLQVVAEVENQHKETWTSSEYELVALTISSGVLLCERGSSSSFIGMLIKQDIVDTAAEPDFITHSHARKLVGGSFLGGLRNAAAWIHNRLPDLKSFLGKVDHPVAQTAHKVLDAVGYGITGAGSHGKLANRLY
jgi:hypothetical protein